MSHNYTTIQSYDENVDDYVKNSYKEVRDEWSGWIDAVTNSLSRNSKILEIGSGTGRDANYIEKKGLRVERTDASAGFVELIKSKGNEARILDILEDEIEGQYDLIFANAVLLHFNNEQLVNILIKIRKRLKREGSLAFSLQEGDGEEVKTNKGGQRFFKYWQSTEIEKILRENGFVSLDVRVVKSTKLNHKSWILIQARRAP